MTKKEIEIKVDVMRQFEMLRNTTFKDPLCFLDEDIQNADRSGAKNVRIYMRNGALVIENDGSVLQDPEVLFTMGKSGWDDAVKETENPFGMGFFSNIPASNFIEIFSANFRVVFDEREGLTIYSEETESYYDGFKLILHNFNLAGVYSWNIEERVQLLGRHIHHMNIFFNGYEIEKKSKTEGDGLPFELSVTEGELFIGWLSFTNDYWVSNRIKVFYKGRYVTALDMFPYVKGELHIHDHVLTLQSPDRKDIIQDEKFSTFKKQLRTYVEEMAEMAMLTGREEDILEYEDALNHFANTESLRYRIPFSVFDGKDNEDMSYLDGIALAISKDENIKTLGAAEVFLKAEEKEKEEREKELSFVLELEEEKPVQPEPHEEDEDEEEEDEYETEEVIEEPTTATTTRTIRATRPKKKKKQPKKDTPKPHVQTSKMYLSEENKDTVFWVKLEEVHQFKKRMELIKQYGIRLVVAKNKIEEKMLEASIHAHIFHLSHLEEKVTIKSYISNKELVGKEQRASMLLDMISRMYGYDKNVFVIGDVIITKLIEIPTLQLEFEKIEDEMTVVANKEEQLIYLDRSIIENSMLSDHVNETIEMSDYKFILLHLKQFIEEISLLDKRGNKQELYEKTVMALAIA